ncbi:hypothetical protein SDJN02_17234, partial [Cucurbita argyrosperma subsp. argyrosperma]
MITKATNSAINDNIRPVVSSNETENTNYLKSLNSNPQIQSCLELQDPILSMTKAEQIHLPLHVLSSQPYMMSTMTKTTERGCKLKVNDARPRPVRHFLEHSNPLKIRKLWFHNTNLGA